MPIVKDRANYLLVAVVAAAVGVGGSVLSQRYLGVCHCGVNCCGGSPSHPMQPRSPDPFGSKYVLQGDGTFWRYEGGRVVGRWNPYNSVYEVWDSQRGAWVKGPPPLGDRVPSHRGELPKAVGEA